MNSSKTNNVDVTLTVLYWVFFAIEIGFSVMVVNGAFADVLFGAGLTVAAYLAFGIVACIRKARRVRRMCAQA